LLSRLQHELREKVMNSDPREVAQVWRYTYGWMVVSNVIEFEMPQNKQQH